MGDSSHRAYDPPMPDKPQRRYETIAGRRIHYRWVGPASGTTPLVFLHEGLGSVELWRTFPSDVASQSGHPALLYSRYGYGWSEPLQAPRTAEYMHDEGLVSLPRLIDSQLGTAPILIGHSDGASISMIYAGAGHEVAGLVLISPHVLVEEEGLRSIRAIYESYPRSDLPEKLAKHHADADATFNGWAQVWLDPAFRSWNLEEYLKGIDCPVLLIQCEGDEYGSLRQLDIIESRVPGDVERLVLPGSGHSPHLTHQDEVVTATVEFIESVERRSLSA